MLIKLPCYRCGHRDCFGFDFCICTECDALLKRSSLIEEYCSLITQGEYIAAEKVLEELEGGE